MSAATETKSEQSTFDRALDDYGKRYGAQFGEFYRWMQREKELAGDRLYRNLRLSIADVIAGRDAGLIERLEESDLLISVARTYHNAASILQTAYDAVLRTRYEHEAHVTDTRWPMVRLGEAEMKEWNARRSRDAWDAWDADEPVLEQRIRRLRACHTGQREADETIARIYGAEHTE